MSTTMKASVFASLLCGALSLGTLAQNPKPSPLEQGAKPNVEGAQAPAQGGASTGGAHPAVLDAQHRPITAGGFVASGPSTLR